jgi:hypothetical protein
MAGAGIWSFAKFRGQMPRISNNRNSFLANRSQVDCGMPTTTRQYTVECQLLGKIWPRNATDRTVPVELWHSIPRVAFLAFTKTNKILKEKLG